MMFKIYSDPLSIHPRRHELSSYASRSGDFSVTPTRGEEHDARDTIRRHKSTMCTDSKEVVDPFASVSALAQQKLKLADCVTAENAGNIDIIAHTNKREEKHRK